MADNRRPGQPTSGDQIGRETAAYVGRLRNNNYSSIYPLAMRALAATAGLGEIAGDSTASYLTQVRDILLPLTIATCGPADTKTGKYQRLQFTLLVNPESINHGKTHTVNASYSRKGFVTQVWGPNQDLITGNGKTAGFIIPEVGLSNLGMQRSLGFHNFMSFFQTYRNNGYEFMDPLDAKSLTRVINVVHGIELYYDGQISMGHFNNFTLDEAAESPYLFNYNFEFVCSTLNNVYDEVRGHFIPIPPVQDLSDYKAPLKLLSDIDNTPPEIPGWGL